MEFKDYVYKGKRNPAFDYFQTKGKFRTILNGFICHICRFIPSMRIKNNLYRMMGVKIGKNVVIAAYVQLDPYFPELITIEDNVVIGVGTIILTHEYSQKKVRIGKVHLKERSLIGAGSLIRSGVTVGKHAVIAAKSYVNKDVKDNITVGGVPAKTIREKNNQ
jgi:acetyltransferase-like isoleucine patch superfamily enzyme